MANGIYTNSELVQSIIGDLNAMLKQQMVGEHVTACVILTGAVQKLANLKATIDNDLKNRDETIQMLKERLRELGHEVIEVSSEEMK